MKSQNRGITLVALIITVVLLLIIAAVTIKGISGEEIVDKAQETREEVLDLQIEEEIRYAVLKMQNIEDTIEDKPQWLRNELNAALSVGEDRIIVSYKGYKIVLDIKYKIQDMFTAEEWDKTATPEEVFRWGSDDPLSPDYGTVIGYEVAAKSLENKTLKYPSRCTKIMDAYETSTHYNTDNIEKVEIPSTVVSFGQYAFRRTNAGYGFAKLKEVVIEEGVTRLGTSMFLKNSNLETIIIPQSVIYMGSSIFEGCTNLKNITLPSRLLTVPGRAFWNCSSLTEIVIPSSVTTIYNQAFGGCTSIDSIIIPETVTTVDNFIFYNWTSSQKVYVYFDSYSQRPSGWTNLWATNGAQKEYSMNTGEELK